VPPGQRHECDGEGDESADEDRPAGTVGLADPADDRRTHGCATHEDGHVQGITRPRITGSVLSCTVALAAVISVSEDSPTGIRATANQP